MTDAVLNINTAVFRRVLEERIALVRGVQQFFDANTLEEDHAARLVLLDLLRQIDYREKGAA